MVPPPASMIKTCSPGCERVKQLTLGRGTVTDLEVFACLGMSSAEVKTCFSFGHKADIGTSRDDARLDRSGSQLCLLWAAPSVGMGQYQLDIVRDGIPPDFPIRLRGFE